MPSTVTEVQDSIGENYVLRLTAIVIFGLFFVFVDRCKGQFDIESDPISYSSSDSNDAIADLVRRIGENNSELQWDKQKGWLPSLLKSLKIAPESQTLVFSKTSLQIRQISPSNPRAIYFNDDVYVGYVPNGDLIELSAVDPELGAVFYSIDQKQAGGPVIKRDESRCMTCHLNSKTQNVPGYLVRSVYPSASGHPHYSLGTITTDHRTEVKNRFGGWYVTGEHGTIRHRGNEIARKDPANPMDREAGANQKKLPGKFDHQNYLTQTSDIVALMVLEHQTQMHNFITKASYETRQALHYQKNLNKALEEPDDYQSESTIRRIESASDKLVRYLLFCDEAPLESPIAGNSQFAETFANNAIRDKAGRSLRDLDLQSRMFQYPCSFLIHSESFDRLPPLVLNRVYDRLDSVLNGTDQSKEFSHLSKVDRKAIREILLATKPGFSDFVNRSRLDTEQ